MSRVFLRAKTFVCGATNTQGAALLISLLPSCNENNVSVHSLSVFFATARYLWFNIYNFLTEVGPGVQIPEPYV